MFHFDLVGVALDAETHRAGVHRDLFLGRVAPDRVVRPAPGGPRLDEEVGDVEDALVALLLEQDFAVLDVYRRYKQFKPQGIAELNEAGIMLAHALAGEIAQEVDALTTLPEGEQHG